MDETSAPPPSGDTASRYDDMPPPLAPPISRPVQAAPAPVATQFASAPRAASGPLWAKSKLNTTMQMVTGHWCQPNVGVAIAPSEFYDRVTKAVMARNFPGVEFSRVYWKEEAFTGAKREYLRVQRARIVFDICAAPQGAGSFFSSWLCIVPYQISAAHLAGILATFILMAFFIQNIVWGAIYLTLLVSSGFLWGSLGRIMTTTSFKDDFLLGLTGIGPIAKLVAELKPTYYQIDAAILFQSTVQAATLEVIDSLCEQQNTRRLTEQERAPVLREFMKK